MKIAPETIDEIEQRTNILSLAQEYTTMTQKGSRWWGLSPFKQEKTPSFTVSPEKNLYYCFSTQKGGGIFHFIMQVENVGFVEAVELLAKKAGVSIKQRSNNSFSKHYQEKETLTQLHTKITKSFSHLLNNSPAGRQARQYLIDRGITPDTINHRMLGYAPSNPRWIYSFLHAKHYSDEFLRTSGLFSSRSLNQSLFHHRIMFPICSHDGNTIAFGGRAMDDTVMPKYINSSNTTIFHKSSALYGLESASRSARRNNCIYVVEGYLDQLALWQVGIPNTVAPLGTALTEHHIRVIKKMASNVNLVFDSDSAGQQATLRAIKLLLPHEIEPQICVLPQGSDPADMLTKGENIKKILDTNTYNLVEFISTYFLETNSNKLNTALDFNAVFEYISLIGSAVQRENYLNYIANHANIGAKSVFADYEKYLNNTMKKIQRYHQSGAAHTTVDSTIKSDQELFLMLASCLYPQEFALLRFQLEEKYFHNKRARTLFQILNKAFHQNNLNLEYILQQIPEEDLRNYVSKSLVSNEFKEGGIALIRDGIRTLQQRFYKQERSRLINELNHKQRIKQKINAETNNPQAAPNMANIQEKIKAIDQEITSLQYDVIYLNEEIKKHTNNWKKQEE